MRVLVLPLLAFFLGCDDPVDPVVPMDGVVRVSSLGYHNCALTAPGELYCWGANGSGQVGIGTSEPAPDPTRVALSFRAAHLTTGDLHSCALDDAGRAWCWGLNEHGQLGIGSSGRGPPTGPWTVPTPTAVSTEVRFETLTAGAEHTCGLTDNGLAYCWGYDRYGQTGEQIPAGFGESTVAPFEVPGGLRFTGLSAASYFNCGTVGAGSLYCWGNYLDNSGWVIYRNVPALLSQSPAFRSIDGGGHHMCGVTFADTIYCWGADSFGALGIGSDLVQVSSQPVIIQGDFRFSTVTAGDHFTCAIRTDRRAMCWGDGRSGQLGSGSIDVMSSVPVDVAGGHEFLSLSAGTEHVCGVTTTRNVYCWGRLVTAGGHNLHPLPIHVALPIS